MDLEQGAGEARMTWDSPVQFFFTILGFCVGLGNIWRFPYLCQQNGGGQWVMRHLLPVPDCTGIVWRRAEAARVMTPTLCCNRESSLRLTQFSRHVAAAVDGWWGMLDTRTGQIFNRKMRLCVLWSLGLEFFVSLIHLELDTLLHKMIQSSSPSFCLWLFYE